MTDIVEVYWNARPHLDRLGVKVKGGAIDPRGDQVVQEVRKAIVDSFPNDAALVRIAVRTGDPEVDLRVVRRGVEETDRLDELRAVIDEVVMRSASEAA